MVSRPAARASVRASRGRLRTERSRSAAPICSPTINSSRRPGGIERRSQSSLVNSAPLLAEAGLDIELTGFEPAEIDALMGDLIDREDRIRPTRFRQLADGTRQPPRRFVVVRSAPTSLRRRHQGFRGCPQAHAPASAPRWCSPIRLTTSGFHRCQGRGKIKHREFVSGLRRNVPSGVHALSRRAFSSLPPSTRSMARSISSAWTGATRSRS